MFVVLFAVQRAINFLTLIELCVGYLDHWTVIVLEVLLVAEIFQEGAIETRTKYDKVGIISRENTENNFLKL